MLDILSREETERQSKDAYRQWKDRWHENAKRNGEVCKKKGTTIRDLFGCGRNRLGILCGLGQSLENSIKDILAAQEKEGVDVLCIDKAFGVLLARGIKPRYVAVSDAQVSWGTWSKEYLEQTKDVSLICTATSNPEWAENWLGPVYLVVCKDAIKTEEIISELSGGDVIVPASANVGNNLLVVCVELLAYQEVCLVGYDYSWKPDKNYYAFSGDADGIMSDKRQWQKSDYTIANDGEFAYQSSNLTFAARWLKNYYIGMAKNKLTNIYNCSEQGILEEVPKAILSRRIELFKSLPLTDEQKEQINLSRIRVIRAKDDGDFKRLVESGGKIYHIDVSMVPKEHYVA